MNQQEAIEALAKGGPHAFGPVQNHLLLDRLGICYGSVAVPAMVSALLGLGHSPSSSSRRLNVDLEIPVARATALRPCPFSSIATAGRRSNSLFGRPQWVPAACARRTPAMTLSRTSSLSNSALCSALHRRSWRRR